LGQDRPRVGEVKLAEYDGLDRAVVDQLGTDVERPVLDLVDEGVELRLELGSGQVSAQGQRACFRAGDAALAEAGEGGVSVGEELNLSERQKLVK
jgi:hypothetical protein